MNAQCKLDVEGKGKIELDKCNGRNEWLKIHCYSNDINCAFANMQVCATT